MPSVTPPTIVVPGMTASVLHDEYELPPEAVWTTVRRRRYERIALHPKDQRYELVEPARVMSGSPFPLVYEDLIEELRDELSDKQNGKAPVFPFGYDWRLPLDRIEEVLAGFVREAIDRTLLLPHYREDDDYAGNPTVNLIGHSMGGLLIAGYIERHGGALVNKVVTLATPFQGSLEAVLKLATGTADLGDDSGNAQRAPHGAHDSFALSPASQLRGQPHRGPGSGGRHLRAAGLATERARNDRAAGAGPGRIGKRPLRRDARRGEGAQGPNIGAEAVRGRHGGRQGRLARRGRRR